MPPTCPTCRRRITLNAERLFLLEEFLSKHPTGTTFTPLTLAKALNLNGPDKAIYRVMQTLHDKGIIRRIAYGLYSYRNPKEHTNA